MKEIILPELGEGISRAMVACWHRQPGQSIKAGDELVEVVTDKASFCVEAPINGTLQKILIPAGQEGSVGGILGIIETS